MISSWIDFTNRSSPFKMMKSLLSLLPIPPLLLSSCDSDESKDDKSSAGFEVVTYSGTVEEEKKAPKVTNTTIERKPAAPSDSMSKVIAANTEKPKPVPMDQVKPVHLVAKPVPNRPGFVLNPSPKKLSMFGAFPRARSSATQATLTPITSSALPTLDPPSDLFSERRRAASPRPLILPQSTRLKTDT